MTECEEIFVNGLRWLIWLRGAGRAAMIRESGESSAIDPLIRVQTMVKSVRNFEVFHRTWWQKNPSWPDGREPGVGRSIRIGWAETEEQAREMCRKWNSTHNPGHLSDKAEYTAN